MAGQQTVKDEVTSQANNTSDEKDTSIQVDSSAFFHVIVAAVIIVLVLVVAMIARWIYRKRKYNRLRHYLIPTYTFDPNEEETWDVDIDGQESAVLASSSLQGYQSIEAKKNVSAPSTSNKYNP